MLPWECQWVLPCEMADHHDTCNWNDCTGTVFLLFQWFGDFFFCFLSSMLYWNEWWFELGPFPLMNHDEYAYDRNIEMEILRPHHTLTIRSMALLQRKLVLVWMEPIRIHCLRYVQYRIINPELSSELWGNATSASYIFTTLKQSLFFAFGFPLKHSWISAENFSFHHRKCKPKTLGLFIPNEC